jgi:hypothetical protein
MIKKVSYSSGTMIKPVASEQVLASKVLVDRMTKMANDIRSIAPKSDDFLYFSIIFLKAAESAILGDNGLPKKLASGEDAWGFYDESWKWHGNVQPHRNNNGDLFPESELKKATAKWVGMPLCRDHESSSVDGIRGIILDTHYDEKFKQIVGLCALDKVNYPDLARKVETGMVRYGSMGTAVETSICTDCGNRAEVQSDYCAHVTNHTAYGEVNVGLKPIEYSLVVTPAEPGAVLLKVVASLKDYRNEFISHGVEDVDVMLGRLSIQQAGHLNGIMKTACGPDGCSMDRRSSIVKSFLDNNGLVKMAEVPLASALEAPEPLLDLSSSEIANASKLSAIVRTIEEHGNSDSPEVKIAIEALKNILDTNLSEPSLADKTTVSGEPSGLLTPDLPTPTMFGSDTGDAPNFENDAGGVIPVPPLASSELPVAFASGNNGLGDYVDDISINSIMEEIMNESRLRKRAEMRRRVAYHQGGADGVEPTGTYKDEGAAQKNIRDNQDKQMQQTGSMGGADGMHPGDAEVKGKLSRAELEERRIRRTAYHQGGSDGVEPTGTYKDEGAAQKNIRDNQDKQMQQTGSMGGADGMHPGDAEVKGKLSRAAYTGPGLKTKLSVKKAANGSVDRKNSEFRVFSGNDSVITATAGEIFGAELDGQWGWLASKEYGQEVCKQIRTSGLDHVRGLLKGAQDVGAAPMPEFPPMDAAPAGAPPMMEDAGAPELPPMDAMEEAPMEEEEVPAGEGIDNRLAEMEGLISEIRDLADQLADDRVADVDVNIMSGAEPGGDAEETLSLASEIVRQLKTAHAQLDESADEISMVAETYDNLSKLSAEQRSHFSKLASAAVKDCDEVRGEAKALIRVAKALTKTAEGPTADEIGFVEDPLGLAEDPLGLAEDPLGLVEDATLEESSADDAEGVDSLVKDAMNLRRERREGILRNADRKVLETRAARRANILKSATTRAPAAVVVTTAPAVSDGTQKEASQSDSASVIKAKLSDSFAEKKADEDREGYRVMLRRAYDVGMEMQRKGLLPMSKVALDNQVDEIMSFDGKAFEAFKRSIGNARTVRTTKIASDLGGVNVGVETDVAPSEGRMTATSLSSLWE